LNIVSTSLLTSTIQSLGTVGYVSTLSLQSTVRGLGSAGYLSSYISSFVTLTTSSLNVVDRTTGVNTGNIFQSSSLLYFNDVVFAGARVGFGQFLYPQ
jgi:hypothetical protein